MSLRPGLHAIALGIGVVMAAGEALLRRAGMIAGK
jgi:hypothetical protein